MKKFKRIGILTLKDRQTGIEVDVEVEVNLFRPVQTWKTVIPLSKNFEIINIDVK